MISINANHNAFVILFFFQAEDGIRDRNVTGVQTCALPISSDMAHACGRRPGMPHTSSSVPRRSEERREGKRVDLGCCRIITKKNANANSLETLSTTRKRNIVNQYY